MIRLFNKTAERVTLLMNSLKMYAPEGITVQQVANDFYNGADNRLYSGLDAEQRDLMARVAKNSINGAAGEDTVASVVENLLKQLYSKADHRELIDEIARILNMPRGHMILGGQALAALQKAILIPEEVRAFKRAIAEGCRCYQCGVRILGGEICTTLLGNDGVPFLACAVCAQPAVIRCAQGGCEEKVTLKQYIPGKAYTCKTHSMAAKLDAANSKDGSFRAAAERLGLNIQQPAGGQFDQNTATWTVAPGAAIGDTIIVNTGDTATTVNINPAPAPAPTFRQSRW